MRDVYRICTRWPSPRSPARIIAWVEPLPLVRRLWMTGGQIILWVTQKHQATATCDFQRQDSISWDASPSCAASTASDVFCVISLLASEAYPWSAQQTAGVSVALRCGVNAGIGSPPSVVPQITPTAEQLLSCADIYQLVAHLCARVNAVQHPRDPADIRHAGNLSGQLSRNGLFNDRRPAKADQPRIRFGNLARIPTSHSSQ